MYERARSIADCLMVFRIRSSKDFGRSWPSTKVLGRHGTYVLYVRPGVRTVREAAKRPVRTGCVRTVREAARGTRRSGPNVLPTTSTEVLGGLGTLVLPTSGQTY